MSIKLTLSEEEAAAALGCAVSTVQTLAREGRVPAVRFGDAGWRFPLNAFDEFLYDRAMANLKPVTPPAEPVAAGPIRFGNAVAQTTIDPNRKINPGPQAAKAVTGFACGGEVKPKGPPRLVPLMEPPEVGAAFGERSWSVCG